MKKEDCVCEGTDSGCPAGDECGPKRTEPARITFEVTLSVEDVVMALRAGTLGGIEYWGTVTSYYFMPPEGAPDTPLMFIHEDLGSVNHKLTRDMLKRGLSLLATNHFEHWKYLVEGNADRGTGDLLIQYSLFGTLKYG